MKVKVTFERLGRNAGPIPIEIDGLADGPQAADQLAGELFRFVTGLGRYGKKWLMSSDVAVKTDLENMTVIAVVGGLRSVGCGTIEVIEP